MRRCPVCRARNKGKSVCRRCDSDLTDIINIEAQAEFAMTMAVRYLREGNLRRAQSSCTYACRLKRTEFGDRFSGFLDGLKITSRSF